MVLRLMVVVSEPERDWVAAAAAADGRSVSAWLRRLIQREMAGPGSGGRGYVDLGQLEESVRRVEAEASAALASDPRGAHSRRPSLKEPRQRHGFVPMEKNALRCAVEGCGRKKADHRG